MPLPVNMMMAVAPDLQAPVVAITSPADGGYVTKTISLQASASDDRGVTGVQWQVDGVNVGPVQTVAPYTYSLDTSGYSEADHTISAVASDAVGHTTTATITVHVANPSTAAQTISTFNGVSGGSRRAYGSVGSFASPNYGDSRTSGLSTWPGNPYANWGYVLQVRLITQVDSFGHGYEDINGGSGWHSTGLAVGGIQRGSTITDAATVGAWITVPDAAAGSIALRDWLNNAGGVGGNAFTGDVLVQIRYQ